MNIWDILEIEKTKDKEQIQAAYRAKLMKTHPEDDPEGFMELRRAFEEAMKLADMKDEPETSAEKKWGDDPVGRWMQQIDQIYKTFSRRIDPGEWKLMLEDAVCQNLDTRVKARNALLEYFMENIFISREIMQLLDQEFSLMENMDELQEEFPKNYLDYIVIQGMQKKEYPPYDEISGSDDCDFDQYFRLNSQLSQHLSEGETDKSHKVIEKMQFMGIENPYLEVDLAKVYCQESNFEAALEQIEGVLDEYDIDDAYLMHGDILFFMEDHEQAMAEYKFVLDKDPENDWGRMGKAKCLMKKGDFKEANEIFSDVVEKNPYDMDAAMWLKECNKQHIVHLKEQIMTEDNQANFMDLAWCYYQNEEYRQAIALLERISPEDEHRIEYYSLMGRCHLYLEKNQEALVFLEKWESILDSLEPTEENKEKQKKQVPYCLLLQSTVCGKLDLMERALETIEKAMELAPEDAECVMQKGQLLAKQWKLEEAVEVFTKATEVDPENHAAFVLRARALYYMGYYSDAYDDCEKALMIFPYELAAYVFKVKILIEVGEVDAAGEILDYLEGEELAGSELDFLKGFVTEARGQGEEAVAIYQDIIDNYKGELEVEEDDDDEKAIFNVRNLAEVYHHMAVLKIGQPGVTFDEICQYMDKGIKEDPDYIQLVEMKAEFLHENKHPEEALELFAEISQKAPGRIGIYGAMDNLYRELNQWDKAMEFAEKQLEQTQTGYAYMRRGQIHAYMEDNERAEADFNKAIYLAPELAYPYNYMGVLLECQGNEKEALEYYMKAIQVGEHEHDICNEAYRNASNLLCRKNDFESAKDYLDRGFMLTQEKGFLYEKLLVLRRMGHFEEAEKVLEVYAKMEGYSKSNAKYLIEVGHIDREQGFMEAALESYELACNDLAEAGLEAGKVCYYKGQYAKAVDHILDATQVYRREVEANENMFLLGEYYLWAAKAALEGSDPALAGLLADKGLELITDETLALENCLPMVRQIRGGLLAIKGQYEEAEADIQMALEHRKCDYCVHGYCIDACYEMIYLSLLQGNREKALEYLERGMEVDPIDTDFRKMKERLEKE